MYAADGMCCAKQEHYYHQMHAEGERERERETVCAHRVQICISVLNEVWEWTEKQWERNVNYDAFLWLGIRYQSKHFPYVCHRSSAQSHRKRSWQIPGQMPVATVYLPLLNLSLIKCFILTHTHTHKIWNRVDCQCSEKRSKTHKRLKRKLFNWRKHDKMCTFLRKSSFSSYIQQKNKQLIYLVSVGCGRLAEGKGHKTDWHDTEKRVM